MLLSDFTFEEHLQDLFNIITALNCEDIRDLIRFESLILHHAHRKIAWRVLELSTHWGKSPFDILSDHLDSELRSKTFQFQYRDPKFHELIQSYVPAEPTLPFSSKKDLGPVYCVNAENAPQWIMAFKYLLAQLQSYLLVQQFNEENIAKMVVRTDPPNAHTIDEMLPMMFFFEALMPVLKHLISPQWTAHALANAGELVEPFAAIHFTYTFSEIQEARKSRGTFSSDVVTESDEHDLQLALPGHDCESQET